MSLDGPKAVNTSPHPQQSPSPDRSNGATPEASAQHGRGCLDRFREQELETDGEGRGFHQNALQGSIWGSPSDRSCCERGQLPQLLAELRPMSVRSAGRGRLGRDGKAAPQKHFRARAHSLVTSPHQASVSPAFRWELHSSKNGSA